MPRRAGDDDNAATHAAVAAWLSRNHPVVNPSLPHPCSPNPYPTSPYPTSPRSPYPPPRVVRFADEVSVDGPSTPPGCVSVPVSVPGAVWRGSGLRSAIGSRLADALRREEDEYGEEKKTEKVKYGPLTLSGWIVAVGVFAVVVAGIGLVANGVALMRRGGGGGAKAEGRA